MDSDNIIQELNKRFAVPLKEFHKRRIIFWYDEDEEFKDSITDLELDNAKIAVLNGNNNFAVKKLLSIDDTTSNYLVYCPFLYDKLEKNWLLDVQLYSEEFRADLISIWLDEMGIPPTPEMRKHVKAYSKFFRAKARRDKIALQNPDVPGKLHLAIMGVLCNLKNVTPAAILKEVLLSGLDNDTNSLYGEFVNYSADMVFWRMVGQGTGYDAEQPDVGQLAAHILLTAASQTIHQEYLSGLDNYISYPHQFFCFNFVSDWLRSDDYEKLYDIADSIDEKLNLSKRFMKLEIGDLVNTEVFPCLDEIILIKLMNDIKNNIINIDMIRSVVEKRRTTAGYARFKEFYDGLLQVANMQMFYKEHSDGFHYADPRKIWKKYTSEYYLMDTYYRLFQKSFEDSQKSYNSNLADYFSSVKDYVEGLYKNWFLGKLGENWCSICSEELQKYGRIMEIPQQTDFYKNRIKNADSRVFVVISDAMRYEVAVSLAEQLKRETQADVKLQDMQGIFPTITKFGMAALLPHNSITAVLQGNDLKVLADGVSTDASSRDKVLKSANPESLAVRFADLVSAKRADRSALVKGREVVYIYHDTIDEASHISDSMVFSACDETIHELKNLVKIIVNDFGGIHILFTADHGFLYTGSLMTEDDKLGKGGFADQIVEYGRRYAILKKGAEPDYLQKVKFLDGASEYESFAPKENVRIKMNGGGLNFVHGGISLQEMVVPVIDYHYLRNQSKQYQKNKSKYDTKPVEISLLSNIHKVSNMIFSLNFYQKDSVSDNREAAEYQVYFTDSDGKKISDVQKIIADKTDSNGQERTFRCSFNLMPLKYDSRAIYYLVIADADEMVVFKEEFQIDIAFAVDDFNFFS